MVIAVVTLALVGGGYLLLVDSGPGGRGEGDPSAGVRPFRVRLQATSDRSPDGREFRFSWGDAAPEKSATVRGEAWTRWFDFGDPEIAAIRAAPAYPFWLPAHQLQGSFVLQGADDTTSIRIQIALSETGRTISTKTQTFANRPNQITDVTYYLWRETSGSPRAGSMADFYQRYWKTFEKYALPRAERPKHFIIGDRLDAYGELPAWEEGIESLTGIGVNTLMVPTPNATLRELLSKSGIRTGTTEYCPPGYSSDYSTNTTCGWNSRPSTPDPEGLDKWAKEIADEFERAGYPAGGLTIFGMSDEPQWAIPETLAALSSDQGALTRFRGYLRDQGLTPDAVGHRTWDDVLPIGWSRSTGDLPSRRLFYWSMRFLSWDASRHFANANAALQQYLPQSLVYTNWANNYGRLYNPYGPEVPDSGASNHDWFEFARQGGGTTLWTEDWVPDDVGWLWSFHANRMASAARTAGLPFGGYVVGARLGDIDGGAVRKAMTLVGHGAKQVFYYHFGPKLLFTGNADGWSDNALANPAVIRDIAEANRLIAKSEDLLWSGTPTDASVAILHPRSAQLWDRYDLKNPVSDSADFIERNSVDYMSEVRGMELALTHAKIPFHFISEDDLRPDVLARYKVVYVTGPNIPNDGQSALAAWTESGGTLVKVSNAGTADAYNETTSTLSTLGGIEETPRQRHQMQSVYLDSLHAVTGGGGSADVRTVRGAVSRSSGVVQAKFADSSPAILEAPVGRGRVVHFAFLPGLAYWMGGDFSGGGISFGTEHRRFPDSFPAIVRQWITGPVQTAGVKPLVEVAEPLVFAPVLSSPGGWAVTLTNWSNGELRDLTVRLRPPFTPARLNSARHGDLKFRMTDDGGFELTLPVLDAADVIRVYSS